MKYFIPEWDDRVDPKFDFINDRHSEAHTENPVDNDFYMWNIFGLEKVPFDGVLVSRMTIMGNKTKYNRVLEGGIHNTLRLPQNFEVMGDCGAWGYIKENTPPFKTAETLDYYVKCGFNYGVSVDHLIVPAFREENQTRLKLTLENAREMFELWQSKDRYLNSIRIMGSAQGWDPLSYRKSIRELLEIGYDYIAIGGIARSPTGIDNGSTDSKTVFNIVRTAYDEISKWMQDTRKKVDLHLFGIARPELISKLTNYGVTSFDSASYLRKAWLSGDKNYLTTDGEFFGAIRIPQIDKSPLTNSISDKSQLVELEKLALEKVRKYLVISS